MLKTIRDRLKNKKGFTLIELIVVIAIIAILIALIAPNVLKFVGQASDTAMNANAKSLYTAAATYVADQYVHGGAELDSTNVGTADKIAETLKDYLDEATKKKLKSGSVTAKIEVNSEGLPKSAKWGENGKSGQYGETVSISS